MLKFILFSALLVVFISSTLGIAPNWEITGLTIINIAIYLVGLILVMTEMMGGKIFRKKLTGVGFAIAIVIAVILSVVYSSFIGVYEGELFDNLRQAKAMVAQPALLYILAFMLIDSREQGMRFLLITVLVMGLFNILSVVAAQLGIEVFQISHTYDVEEDYRKRLAGFTGNPNKTAYLTCVLIAFQYYFYKYDKNRMIRIIMAVTMMGGAIVVMLSGSRGGMLVLLILVFALAYKLKDFKVIYATVLSIPIFVAALIFSESILIDNAIDRLDTLTSEDKSVVTSGRNVIWAELLSDYSENPIGVVAGNGFGAAKSMGVKAQPHNLYLRVLVEFGAIGLLLFIYFIRSMFKKIQSLNIDDGDNLYAFVTASGFVVVFAWLFTSLIGVLDLIWFTIGIAVATMSSKSINSSKVLQDGAPDPSLGNEFSQKNSRILIKSGARQ